MKRTQVAGPFSHMTLAEMMANEAAATAAYERHVRASSSDWRRHPSWTELPAEDRQYWRLRVRVASTEYEAHGVDLQPFELGPDRPPRTHGAIPADGLRDFEAVKPGPVGGAS